MSSSSPRVSVVLTSRDRPELARRALATALSQTVRDIEVVVVDDGSDPAFDLDDTDPRVSLIRLPESRGVSAARNAGLARSRGEWVTFLDDDDELLPQMVEVSLEAADRSSLPPPIAVVSAIEVVHEHGPPEVRLPQSLPKGRDYFLEEVAKGRPSVGNTLLIGRELLGEIGGFDEELRSAVHSELFLRVNAVCSIQGLPTVTYRLGRQPGVHVHMDELGRARAMQLTVCKHSAAFERHPVGHARFLSAIGVSYMKSNHWSEAVRFTTRALRTNPRDAKVVRLWLASLGGPPLLAGYRRVVRGVRRVPRP